MVSKNKLLQQIDNELRGLPSTKTVEVGGHNYGLKVLDRKEESFSKTLVPDGVTLIQAISDTSAPILAMSIQSIDDTPVKEIFNSIPDDYTDEQRDELAQDISGDVQENMIRENIVSWLLKKPGVFVQSLWLEYLNFKGEAKEALDQLSPLSKPTRSSGSKPTSSPEKESASTTQASRV